MSDYKKKIIIVEDKGIVSHDLKKRLEILGYEVPDIATSGEKAVEMAREHKPNLVLMDIQLEGEMDGIEAANIIKDEMDIPVIYLTAFTDEETLKRAMITEPYAYIVKPFEPRELQISIEIALYKHEMESELEEKTDFLDMILKNTEEGIFVLDDDFNYVYINAASGRIMGHDPEDWIGKRAGTHVHPEDAGVGMAALQEMYEKGKADFVARVQRSDGEYRSLHIVYIQITWKGEGHVLGVVNDITEMLGAANKLRESEEKYRSLVEEAGDGILVLDDDATVSLINKFLLDLGGYEEEDVLGHEFMEFIHEEYLPATLKMFQDALDGTVSPAAELELKKKDGTHVSVGYKGTIVYDSEGEFQGIRAIVRDHTLQKQMEEALKDSEEQFRTLFESSTDAVMLLDKEGFFDCNEATLYIFGLEHKSEFIGIHPSQLSPPTQADGVDSLTAANKKIDDAYEWGHNKFEWTHRRKSGEDFPAEVWLTAFELKGKKVLQATVRDLTERKRIEDELAKHRENLEEMVENTWKDLVVSEEKYRNLVERANDGIVIIQDGIIQFANYKLTEMTGFELDELIGSEFTKMLPSEIRELVKEFYTKRMAGEEIPNIYELIVKKKDGSLIPVEINAGMIIYGGKPADLAFIRDLTERKKAEAALIESEERFRQVAESTGEWIWEVDAQGLYTYASPVVESILGYKPEEVVGKKHFYDFFIPDKRDELKEMAFEVFSRKESFKNFINENIHKDGQIVYLETSGSPILDKNGGLLGYRGADTDVTERKRAEEAPLLTQFMLDRLSDAAFWMDSNARFFYVNNAACENLGYTRAELLGMSVHDIDIDFNEDIWPDHWEEIKKGLSSTIESTHTRKDGTTFPVEIANSYIRYKDKEYNCAIVRNITERKEAEKTLREGEKFLSNVFSSIQDGLIIMNTDLRIVNTNATIEKWFPHKMPIVGKTCNDLLFCAVVDESSCPSFAVMQYDEPASRIIPWVGEDGEEIGWLELHSFPLHDSETGELTGAIEYVRDITERKRAETEKEEFQNQLDAFFQASTDGIGIQQDGKFIYANPKLVVLFGCSDVSELLGTSSADYMTAESAHMVSDYHRSRVAGEYAPTHYEFQVLRKNGMIFDAEVSIHQYKIKDEFFTVGFVRDITELKKSREHEVQSRIMEAQFEMKSVITDLVPIFLDSMGSADRVQLMDNLSKKLDDVLGKRYYDDMSKSTARDIGMSYIRVLMDLGGEAYLDCADEDSCVTKVRKCPWENQKTKNLILCILCRGIAGRFAQHSTSDIMIKLRKTMADGSSECEITVEKQDK